MGVVEASIVEDDDAAVGNGVVGAVSLVGEALGGHEQVLF